MLTSKPDQNNYRLNGRCVAVVASAFLMTSCSTLDNPFKESLIQLGNAVCAKEASQIYFGSNEDQLTLTAAQVVSRIGNELQQCPTRRILLLAVSGNDGDPASSIVSDNRVKIVGDILVSQGIDRKRLVKISDQRMVKIAPRGPIGGVLVMTQQ